MLLHGKAKTGMCKKTTSNLQDLKPVDYSMWAILRKKVYKMHN